jgi:hypothetical protein
MSSHSALSPYTAHPRRPSSALLYARPVWAGLSIIVMWLAVLFVGVFGGNITHTGAGGGTSSVPVAVVVAGVALVATWVLGRAAFGATPETDALRALLQERQAREELAAEVAELRSRLSA